MCFLLFPSVNLFFSEIGDVFLSRVQEEVKQREQSLRKAEQEMDSLSFRNQQLAKRVELLQEELQVIESRSKKGKV